MILCGDNLHVLILQLQLLPINVWQCSVTCLDGPLTVHHKYVILVCRLVNNSSFFNVDLQTIPICKRLPVFSNISQGTTDIRVQATMKRNVIGCHTINRAPSFVLSSSARKDRDRLRPGIYNCVQYIV